MIKFLIHLKSTKQSAIDRRSEIGTEPWETIAPLLRSGHDLDAKFWWQMTGSILGILMEEAGYDIQSQYLGLLFHLHYIVPRLGPGASQGSNTLAWRSFMTDDFSPLEYSWSWDTPKSGPKVRYSIEAIGPSAGCPSDLFNQASTLELRQDLANSFPSMNFTWFDILQGAFCDNKIRLQSSSRNLTGLSSSSSLFLAFELGNNLASKAYFLPVKADQYGIAQLKMLNDAVETLRSHGFALAGYNKFLQFTQTGQGAKLGIIAVAIDCTSPEDSRFKIYVRSPETSFRSVCEMMDLGGTINTLTEASTRELKDLWSLTLGLKPDFSETEELQFVEHETAGVLYYFDIKPHGTAIEPKLYVPIKHYAKDDLAAAKGLGTYLSSRGRDRHFHNYMRALERTCTHRSLSDGKGFQTYIGTSIHRDGSLALCSYINGEVHHSARDIF